MEELVYSALCDLVLAFILETLECVEVVRASVFQSGDREPWEPWEPWLIGEHLIGVMMLVVLVCR